MLSIAFALPATPDAAIYKYRDADGRLNFVDDENKIPVQFRGQAKSIKEAPAPTPVQDNDNPAVDLETTSVYEDFVERRQQKELEKYQTPVVIEKNRVLVPAEVSIGGRTAKLNLLLDTGATRTVFHRQSLEELDLPSGKGYKARVAGGGIVKSRKIKFTKIRVGPFEIARANAMVINLEGRKVPFDGMLGMDFLKNHPYQIDFDQMLITWEKPSK